MLDMDDDTLVAMALREHAQTCEAIAERYAVTHTLLNESNRASWRMRAGRCRELAREYEAKGAFRVSR